MCLLKKGFRGAAGVAYEIRFMKSIRLSLAVLLVGMMLTSCGGSGNKASVESASMNQTSEDVGQTPEEFVREKYGLDYTSEQEYEELCAKGRELWTYEGLGLIPTLAKAYQKEDAYFEQMNKKYMQIHDDIGGLVFAIVLQHGQGRQDGQDEQALLEMMEEANYGNKKQCRVLIDAVKQDGFLRKELDQMRAAHRERLEKRIIEETDKLVGKRISLPYTTNVDLPDGYIQEVCLSVYKKTYDDDFPYKMEVEVITREKNSLLSSFRVGELHEHFGSRYMEGSRGKNAYSISWQQLAYFRPGATVDLHFYGGR